MRPGRPRPRRIPAETSVGVTYASVGGSADPSIRRPGAPDTSVGVAMRPLGAATAPTMRPLESPEPRFVRQLGAPVAT